VEDDVPGQKRSAPIDFDGESLPPPIFQLKESIVFQCKLGRHDTRLYFAM
jgi:hypothetical protein